MPDTQSITIRRLAESDSMAELTDLLHRAYKALGDMGFRFFATHQTESQTAERVHSGECFVALVEKTIVGTITYYRSAHANGPAWYNRDDVGYFGQFGVEPKLQGRGIGNMLLLHVEKITQEKGMAELALDTAEGAIDLIDYYTRHGYRFIEYHQWDVTNYRSLVMSKRLSDWA